MFFEINVNIFVVVLLLIVFFYFLKDCKRPKNFPNGPMFLPFLGTSWTIPVKGIEFVVPRWKKKYGNLVGHRFYYKNMVVFCGSQEIVEGLKHPNFQGRYVSDFLMQRTCNKPLGFIFADDETWSEVRRFALRYFGTVFTKELETILHDELLEEFNTFRSGEIHDIKASFIKSPIYAILRIIAGVSGKDFESEIVDILEKTEKGFTAGRLSGIESVYPSLMRFFHNPFFVDAARVTHEFLKARLEEHKKSFDPLDIKNYTDAFINESVKELELHGKVNNFTESEYLSCGIDLVQAGNESVAKTLQFTFLYVGMNPRVQLKLQEEIDRVIGSSRYPTLNDRGNMPYLEATILEVMRINPTAPVGAMHRVTKDTQFREYFFEKDTLITFALKYAMHDPEYWQDPDQFLPERFLEDDSLKKKLVNFGLGKRSCIGEVFARNFVFLFLAYFFQRFSIKIPDNYKPSTKPILGISNRPKPFKLIITKRESLSLD